MAIPANLDAFIPREDFFAEADHPNPFDEFKEFGMVELGTSVIDLLRKPDFQRETAAWEPERIKEFIKSFADGDLIPAVIFWGSRKTGNIFVVDGAHRLSALIAWIKDDYGDKDISQKFFEYRPNLDQIKAADQTRTLINTAVGSYKDIFDPEKATQYGNVLTLLKRRRISVQWVQGDASKAESSFFKINLQSVRLEKTELYLIKTRNKPNTIATRAIVRAGAGYKYWKGFSERNQQGTVRFAKDIHEILFKPPLIQPIKTLELPFGGQPYGGDGMRLTLELVEFSNKAARNVENPEGDRTVESLQRTFNIAAMMCGQDISSLGLHPAVYVYSHATGKHQASAFMAIARWVVDLKARNLLEAFCAARHDFEEFLVTNESIGREIVSERGSRSRAVPKLIEYYQFLFDRFLEGSSSQVVMKKLEGSPTLKGFVATANAGRVEEHGLKFSTEVKSQLYIKDSLQGALRCEICRARLYPRLFTYDHLVEKRNDGKGDPKNARRTHFYCNGNRDKVERAIFSLKSKMAFSQ